MNELPDSICHLTRMVDLHRARNLVNTMTDSVVVCIARHARLSHIARLSDTVSVGIALTRSVAVNELIMPATYASKLDSKLSDSIEVNVRPDSPTT